jgi:hypothetical protein
VLGGLGPCNVQSLLDLSTTCTFSKNGKGENAPKSGRLAKMDFLASIYLERKPIWLYALVDFTYFEPEFG